MQRTQKAYSFYYNGHWNTFDVLVGSLTEHVYGEIGDSFSIPDYESDFKIFEKYSIIRVENMTCKKL